MHYAAIAPTKVLCENDCLAKRPAQFCLAQQYLKDEKYAKWYREWVESRHTTYIGQADRVTILDNGAWEKELVNFSDLWDIVETLHPQVLVLPDVMNDNRMTKYLHRAFKAYVAATIREPSFVFMDVLQGNDIWDYLETYIASQAPWIGFPRCMNDHNEGLRVQVAKRLQALGMWKKDVKHHALGMYDGDYGECRKLAKLGFYSIDSSYPIWRQAMQHPRTLNEDIQFDAIEYLAVGHLQYALKEADNACSGR